MVTEQRFLDDEAPGPDDAGYEVPDDYDLPVYVISVAAELADLHPQTLRSYESRGLMEPHRTDGGTRRYSRRDVDRLRFIRHLTQEEGLNLSGVRVVLDLGEQLERARDRIDELEEVVRRLAGRLDDTDRRPEIVKAPGRQIAPHRRPRRRRGSRAGHI